MKREYFKWRITLLSPHKHHISKVVPTKKVPKGGKIYIVTQKNKFLCIYTSEVILCYLSVLQLVWIYAKEIFKVKFSIKYEGKLSLARLSEPIYA